MKRITLFVWLLLLAPMLAQAQGIGVINSEVDGDPANVYAYKVVWPNGTVSITGGVLTYTAAAGGLGDFLADGSVPMTAAIVPNAANTIALGSATAEWADLFLGDGAVIYGQNDSSATLTSSASKWTANNFGVTTAMTLPATLSSAAAVTWTLMDNQASGLSFGATGSADILKVGTLDAGPTVAVAGNLSATTYGSTGTVTDAELLYLADVTSAIQAQLNLKAPLAGPTFTGAVTLDAVADAIVNIDRGAQATDVGVLVFKDAGTATWYVGQQNATNVFSIRQNLDLASGNGVEIVQDDNAQEFTDDDASQSVLSIRPEIAQTGTAGYIGIELDVTETTIGSGTNRLLDLQVGNASKFYVDRLGAVTATGFTTTRNATASQFLTLYEDTDLGDDYITLTATGGVGAADNATWSSSAGIDNMDFGALNLVGTGYIALGADPADAGAIRLSNATVIAWEDATEASITHVDNTGLKFNLPITLSNDESISNVDDTEITFVGTEALSLDLDTGTANQVAWQNRTTSSTGVTAMSFSALNLVTTGTIAGMVAPVVVLVPSGVHDGGADQAIMTDAGIDIGASALIGMTVYNITDGSSCTITANAATTITCTLAGGTQNDWDNDDVWQVGPGPGQSGSIFYVAGAGTARHPATAGYAACYVADGTNKLTIDMASDAMIFTGTLDAAVVTLDAGDCIDSSDTTTDDFICLHNKSATVVKGFGKRGTWADGGAS